MSQSRVGARGDGQPPTEWQSFLNFLLRCYVSPIANERWDMATATTRAAPPSMRLTPTGRAAAAALGRHRDRPLRHALSAIDVSAATATCCALCGNPNICRWGKSRRGLQRWRCRACERSFTAATGTAVARVHHLDKLRLAAVDMLDHTPASCRKLAARLGLDRMTVWRWRRLISAAWADRETMCDPAHHGEASATVILRESRKASREWVKHQFDPMHHPAPDRLRWIDYRMLDLPLPEPMSRYRVSLRLDPVLDCPKSDRADRQGCVPPVEWPPRRPLHHPTGGTLAGRRANVAPAGRAERNACRAHLTMDTQPAGADMLADQLYRFINLFRGPATRHLHIYRAWFAARLESATTGQRNSQ